MSRPKKKSAIALEEEIDSLTDALNDICLQDVSHGSSIPIEDLRKLSVNSTFSKYSRVVTEFVQLKQREGATEEALEVIKGFKDIRKMWNSKVTEIRNRRRELEEEVEDSQSLSSFITLGTEVSANTKINYFLNKVNDDRQSLEACALVSETPVPSNQLSATETPMQVIHNHPGDEAQSQSVVPSLKPQQETVSRTPHQKSPLHSFPPLLSNESQSIIITPVSITRENQCKNVCEKRTSVYFPDELPPSVHKMNPNSPAYVPPLPGNLSPKNPTSYSFNMPYQSSTQTTYCLGGVAPSIPSTTHPVTHLFASAQPHHPPANSRSTSYETEHRSSTADYLVKKEIGVMETEPFDGDATKFHNWYRKMNEKAKSLQLCNYEMISLMENNTKGEPKQIIQDHQNCLFDNSEEALRLICDDLYKRYGDGDKIYNELLKKLKKIAKIQTCSHTDLPRLKELSRVCKLIKFNMSMSGSLQIFNFDAGMRQVYTLFPAALFQEWSKKVSEVKNNRRSVTFDQLVNTLEASIDQISALEPVHDTPKRSAPVIRSYATNVHSPENIEQKLMEKSQWNKQRESTHCEFHGTNGHDINNCRSFLSLPQNERVAFIKEKWLCYNCLGNHLIRHCDLAVYCEKCKSDKHPTLLHRDETTKRSIPRDYVQSRDTQQNSHSRDVTTTTTRTNDVDVNSEGTEEVSTSCSKIVLVNVRAPNGKNSKCYCIIDEQSSCSFISPELASKLEVTGPVIDFSLSTMSGSKVSTRGKIISGLSIQGVDEPAYYQLPNLVTSAFIPNCLEEVATPKLVASQNHIKKFANNFQDFDSSATVMLLLGRDSGSLMSTRCHTAKAPFVHQTKLGWAIVGIINSNSTQSLNSGVSTTNSTTESAYKIKFSLPSTNILAKLPYSCDLFSRLPDDELPGLSSDDVQFVKIVSEGTRVNSEGHLEMPLPFKAANHAMPNNCTAIYARTQNTLSRLKMQPVKLQKSLDAMGKYLDAGHVEFVPQTQIFPTQGKAWWLPVLPVSHPKKDKLRLVFDSSASYKGVSLNNSLLQGPDNNNKLKSVLIGFRDGPIAISADIESMFHNFHLYEEERDYTRFFWFKDNQPQNDLVQMRAKVHIFGNRPSPSIANYGLKYATDTADVSHRSGKEFIQNSMYVDDGLKAMDSVEEAINTLQSAREILQKFKIRLHKISSNSKEVMDEFPRSELFFDPDVCLSCEESCSALGVKWNVSQDTLSITVEIPQRPFTKRGMISTVNTLFDPLGLVCPLILQGRLIQREILSTKESNLDWDDPLPTKFRPSWEKWVSSLSYASFLRLDRSYYPIDMVPISKRELHVFADASEVAIGFVMYLKTFSGSKTHVSFVLAGSKVAPRDAVSMPRLELCAALEAARAATEVLLQLDICMENVFFYSDSRVTLGYLNNKERRFLRYVSRRVEIVRSLTEISQWSFIDGKLNPADITTRPCEYQTLVRSNWFSGPDFLWELDFTPQGCGNLQDVSLPEENVKVLTVKISKATEMMSLVCEMVSQVSTWKSLLKNAKALMVCLKWVDEAKQRCGVSLAPRPGCKSLDDRQVILFLVRHAQESLLTSSSFQKHPAIPFVDEHLIVRVGGRLRNSSIPYQERHPIYLPKDAPLTKLVFERFHELAKHQGRVITLNAIRTNGFYCDNMKKLVSSLIQNCVTCRKLRASPKAPLMADLPLVRLEEVPPFTNVGVDLFGPFLVSEGMNTRRSNSTKKFWGVLFICLVSRAVHIETVPGLDGSSFKNALKRFIAIRGTCKRIRSDNGTNLVSTKSEIDSSIVLTALEEEASASGIEWITTPPGASHFGGSWERAIGSVKKILNASLMQLGQRNISSDELNTLLQECAAIINSTPLYDTPCRADEPLPLTPGHLLFMKDNANYSPFGEFSEADLNAYGKRRWRRMQHIADEFWRRWRTNYLQSLQLREKWTKSRRNLRFGDVVLLRDKNLRRRDWSTAVVQTARPSTDGVVRECIVKTPSGTFRRCANDLILLCEAN